MENSILSYTFCNEFSFLIWKLIFSSFQNLKECLLEFLEKELGDKYTPVAEVAWKKILRVMVQKIDEGMETYYSEHPEKT